MQTRTYRAPGVTSEELAERVRLWFLEKNFETQSLKLPNGSLIVQGYQDDIWRVAVGLAAALTVQVREVGDDTVEVTIGAGAWADKLVVAGIGLLLFLPLVVPAAWGTWEQYRLDQQVWTVVESALPTDTEKLDYTPTAVEPGSSALPEAWFNEQTNEVYSVQFFQRMSSWQAAIADGRIEPEEIQTQAERVNGLLRSLETTLNDQAHAKLTETFGELAVLQGMQSYALLETGASAPTSGGTTTVIKPSPAADTPVDPPTL